MKLISVFLALAVAACGAAQSVAAPLEAYGGLPTIDTVEISPDGATLAVAISTGEARGIMIKRLSDGAVERVAVGSAKVRRLDWVGPEHLIITTSQTGHIADLIGGRSENFLGFDLNLRTHKLQRLLEHPPIESQTGTRIHGKGVKVSAALNVLAGAPEVRVVAGQPTLFLKGVSFRDEYGALTLFQVDLPSGSPRFVEVGDRYTQQMLLGSDGAIVAKTLYDPNSGRWALTLGQPDGGWKENRAVQAKLDPPYLVGLGRAAGSVVVAESGETGAIVREVSVDGTWGAPLDVADADGAIFDPDSHLLIGVHGLVGDEERYTFFDPQDQKAWDMVRRAFKGDRVRLESWTRDRKKIVVLADSATEGAGYALVDLAAHSASWIGARYGALLPEDLSKVEPVRFKAADDLELTGYLTLPRGRPAKDLPLIVFPHGGPAARDEPGFDWWAQAMASRGYAVLQVNFRGSDGLGRALLEAGYGQWGRKMQTDLSDGVRYLAAQGTIDPKRVCIVGASYGGYAALAGATLDTGIYRCAVSVAGPSDLGRMVDKSGRMGRRYWTRFMGAKNADDPVLSAISPADHADKVTIPILMIHGRDDTVVPLEQSRIMADALKKAGKPAELVVMAGEDHWLSRGETRREMLTATMSFVEKHNPPT